MPWYSFPSTEGPVPARPPALAPQRQRSTDRGQVIAGMDLQWLAIIPILSLLMLVHELGHYVTARRAGIVVQEFGFGLPPRMIGYERNGIIYSLNWIPVGAFVKMLGEEDPEAEGSFA